MTIHSRNNYTSLALVDVDFDSAPVENKPVSKYSSLKYSFDYQTAP